jgi:hypothetical protein
MRRTILSALGRIDDEELREAVALHLCAQRPSTRDALVFLRRLRLQRRPPATKDALSDVIRQAINTYLSAHEPISYDQVRQALLQVWRDTCTTENATERKERPGTPP